MRILGFTAFASFVAVLMLACGGKQNVEDYSDLDFEVEGNPEKVAFIEDFYEKIYQNFNDPEALYNLVSDKLSERGDSIARAVTGEDEQNAWKILKPKALDSIPDPDLMNPVFVQLHTLDSLDNPELKDNYYDVQIEDLSQQNHTIMLYVVGTNGNFKIDSISNPDYAKTVGTTNETETKEEN